MQRRPKIVAATSVVVVEGRKPWVVGVVIDPDLNPKATCGRAVCKLGQCDRPGPVFSDNEFSAVDTESAVLARPRDTPRMAIASS